MLRFKTRKETVRIARKNILWVPALNYRITARSHKVKLGKDEVQDGNDKRRVYDTMSELYRNGQDPWLSDHPISAVELVYARTLLDGTIDLSDEALTELLRADQVLDDVTTIGVWGHCRDKTMDDVINDNPDTARNDEISIPCMLSTYENVDQLYFDQVHENEGSDVGKAATSAKDKLTAVLRSMDISNVKALTRSAVKAQGHKEGTAMKLRAAGYAILAFGDDMRARFLAKQPAKDKRKYATDCPISWQAIDHLELVKQCYPVLEAKTALVEAEVGDADKGTLATLSDTLVETTKQCASAVELLVQESLSGKGKDKVIGKDVWKAGWHAKIGTVVGAIRADHLKGDGFTRSSKYKDVYTADLEYLRKLIIADKAKVEAKAKAKV